MTNEQAAALLIETAARGAASYHPGYKWTVDYAAECKAYFAGVDIEKYLKKFARRESPELFDQRKEITAHVNRSLGASLMRPFQKVPRSNLNRVLSFAGDPDGLRSMEFDAEVLSGFYPGGADRYVFERMLYWAIFDPNAFVVVEFESTDGVMRAKPYPFEVTSGMAVRFQLDKFGSTEWLISRQATVVEKQAIERLTLYQANQTVVLQQIPDVLVRSMTVAIPTALPTELESGQMVKLENGKVFQIEIPIPTGFDQCPAVRAGYVENPKDDGATRVSIFDAALPYAKKIVKINSELDITTAFLAFPVSVRYQENCEAVGCLKGTQPNGTACTVCHGTGVKPRPTSAAEEIVLAMPNSPDDMIDVTKVLHYAYPPTDAVKMQMELMTTYLQAAKEAVFNSQMFTKQETAQTATYHSIELQSVYDTLYPYARHIAKGWRFIAQCCKSFTGFEGDMTAALVFPQDFRFETAAELFSELKSARDAGAGKEVTDMLSERIISRMLIDDPERAQEVRAEMRINPFSGFNDAQVLQALSSDLVPRWKKILYVNFKDILLQLEIQNPGFFRLPFTRQSELARAAAMEIMTGIISEQSALTIGMPDFGDDSVGKIPLALQQLALARERAANAGDTVLSAEIGQKIEELLSRI